MRRFTKSIVLIVLFLAVNYVYSMSIYQHGQSRNTVSYQRRPIQAQRPVQQPKSSSATSQTRRPPKKAVPVQYPRPENRRPSPSTSHSFRPVRRPALLSTTRPSKPRVPETPKRNEGYLFGRREVHPSRVPRFKKYFRTLPKNFEKNKPRGSAANTNSDHHNSGSHGHDHEHKTDKAIHDHEDFMDVEDISHMKGESMNFDQCKRSSPNIEIDEIKYKVAGIADTCPRMTWADAADFCQRNRMDLVSLGQSLDPSTAEKIMNLTEVFDLEGFWTGGYVTHPDDERVPNSIIWSSTSQETEIVAPGEGYFSQTGESGLPQPDNWEFKTAGGIDPSKEEHCVAVLNDLFDDGKVLHDLVCTQKLPVVCQEVDFNMMSIENLLPDS